MNKFDCNWSAMRSGCVYVDAFAQSLSKRFRMTKQRELFEVVDLALFLVEVGRAESAHALLGGVARAAVFDGNYNTWTPLGYGLAVYARIGRLLGDAESQYRAMETLRAHPFIVTPSDVLVREILSEHKGLLVRARLQTKKWGCQLLSRHMMKLVFVAEAFLAGFPEFAKVREYEAHWSASLAETTQVLRERLGPVVSGS